MFYRKWKTNKSQQLFCHWRVPGFCCRSIQNWQWGTSQHQCVCLHWPVHPEKPWQILGGDAKQMNSVIKLKRPINHRHFDGKASDPWPLQLWQVRGVGVSQPLRAEPYAARTSTLFPETCQKLTLPLIFKTLIEEWWAFLWDLPSNSKLSSKNTQCKNDKLPLSVFGCAVPAVQQIWNTGDWHRGDNILERISETCPVCNTNHV